MTDLYPHSRWNISAHICRCKHIDLYTYTPTLTLTVCVILAQWSCAALLIRPRVLHLKKKKPSAFLLCCTFLWKHIHSGPYVNQVEL